MCDETNFMLKTLILISLLLFSSVWADEWELSEIIVDKPSGRLVSYYKFNKTNGDLIKCSEPYNALKSNHLINHPKMHPDIKYYLRAELELSIENKDKDHGFQDIVFCSKLNEDYSLKNFRLKQPPINTKPYLTD